VLIQNLFLLFASHAIADFALQNDFTATNKNRHVRDKFTPEQRAKMEVIWPWLLTAHSFHHAALVFLVTQNLTLGFLELGFHWVIDFGKCERWYNFHTDQALHLLTKVAWAFMLYWSMV